jgi:hypothetical protein
MSNLVAKSGLDILWRQDPVGLSQAHEAQNNRLHPASVRPFGRHGDWQSSTRSRHTRRSKAVTQIDLDDE